MKTNQIIGIGLGLLFLTLLVLAPPNRPLNDIPFSMDLYSDELVIHPPANYVFDANDLLRVSLISYADNTAKELAVIKLEVSTTVPKLRILFENEAREGIEVCSTFGSEFTGACVIKKIARNDFFPANQSQVFLLLEHDVMDSQGRVQEIRASEQPLPIPFDVQLVSEQNQWIVRFPPEFSVHAGEILDLSYGVDSQTANIVLGDVKFKEDIPRLSQLVIPFSLPPEKNQQTNIQPCPFVQPQLASRVTCNTGDLDPGWFSQAGTHLFVVHQKPADPSNPIGLYVRLNYDSIEFSSPNGAVSPPVPPLTPNQENQPQMVESQVDLELLTTQPTTPSTNPLDGIAQFLGDLWNNWFGGSAAPPQPPYSRPDVASLGELEPKSPTVLQETRALISKVRAVLAEYNTGEKSCDAALSEIKPPIEEHQQTVCPVSSERCAENIQRILAAVEDADRWKRIQASCQQSVEAIRETCASFVKSTTEICQDSLSAIANALDVVLTPPPRQPPAIETTPVSFTATISNMGNFFEVCLDGNNAVPNSRFVFLIDDSLTPLAIVSFSPSEDSHFNQCFDFPWENNRAEFAAEDPPGPFGALFALSYRDVRQDRSSLRLRIEAQTGSSTILATATTVLDLSAQFTSQSTGPVLLEEQKQAAFEALRSLLKTHREENRSCVQTMGESVAVLQQFGLDQSSCEGTSACDSALAAVQAALTGFASELPTVDPSNVESVCAPYLQQVADALEFDLSIRTPEALALKAPLFPWIDVRSQVTGREQSVGNRLNPVRPFNLEISGFDSHRALVIMAQPLENALLPDRLIGCDELLFSLWLNYYTETDGTPQRLSGMDSLADHPDANLEAALQDAVTIDASLGGTTIPAFSSQLFIDPPDGGILREISRPDWQRKFSSNNALWWIKGGVPETDANVVIKITPTVTSDWDGKTLDFYACQFSSRLLPGEFDLSADSWTTVSFGPQRCSSIAECLAEVDEQFKQQLFSFRLPVAPVKGTIWVKENGDSCVDLEPKIIAQAAAIQPVSMLRLQASSTEPKLLIRGTNALHSFTLHEIFTVNLPTDDCFSLNNTTNWSTLKSEGPFVLSAWYASGSAPPVKLEESVIQPNTFSLAREVSIVLPNK